MYCTNYFFCFHRHTTVYEQLIDFKLFDILFEELGGGHFAGVVEEVGGSLGVDVDLKEDVADVTDCALIMTNNFRKEFRCESTVNMLILEHWKKASTP